MDLIGEKVMCNFIYREQATRLTEPPLWSSWIMIKGEDIGILTATKDVSLEHKNTLKISPNPVNENLTIELDKAYSGLLNIYNEIGQLIFSTKLKNYKEFNYDASVLLNGYYSVQLITDNKILKSQFIKVN